MIAVTDLLAKITRGDTMAADQLISAVYPDLKKIAARLFRNERPGHTLQPTALVNEAYLRTFGGQTVDWRDRAHFFAVIASQIRRVLVDHGRATRAEKRGGGFVKVQLDETHDVGVGAFVGDYVVLDNALSALALDDPRAARVVELKHFGGLTDAEIAEVLKISMPTVNRDWRYAKSWLFAYLTA